MAQLLDTSLFSLVTTGSAIGVGWKLNFYIKGTSTRKDTFPTEADADAATSPNANPVVVDASGRLPAIWLADDADYKCVLTDENDVVKGTIAQINGPRLGGTTGSTRVGYSPPASVNTAMATVKPALDALIDGRIDYDPASGGTDDGVVAVYSGTKGSIAFGGTDTTPQNDEIGNWTVVSSNSATEGVDLNGVARVPDLDDMGLYSAGFGRNPMPLQDYSFILGGHDNIAFGVASAAGGAGSATGDPAHPITGRVSFLGYCSFAFGKNAVAKGQSCVAMGDTPYAHSRASVSIGYHTITKASTGGDPGGVASDGIGAVALGYSAVAAGDGAVALGKDVQAYSGSVLIGSGANPGSPMQNRNAGSVGLGAGTIAPFFEVMPGDGTTTNFGYGIVRGKLRGVLDLAAVDQPLYVLEPVETNSASSGTGGLNVRPRYQGTIISGFTFNARSNEPAFEPEADDASTIGSAGFRPSEFFAVTGTINTSDAREKTAVTPLSDAELAAAKDLAREIGWFKWLSAIAEKGDAARRHIGLTVQRAIEVMQAHSLDPFAYAFICFDEWDATETQEAGDRYSFRFDQLLAFIAAGFEQRLSAIEAA